MSSSTQKTIVYQGEPGAYSHLACTLACPEFEPKACAAFEDAFDAVQTGTADLAMIPIENSVAGRVADIHHLMPTAKLHIVGEYFLRVKHHLLGLPGARLDQIKTVMSHVHALGQCRGFIRAHNFLPVVRADTAGSAAIVANKGDPTRGAIASELAGRIYGLVSLAANIEDAQHNTTRFLILSPAAMPPEVDNGPCITTFVFRVRNVPAALYKALGGFATNGVNMTKLESYQLDGQFTATQFYADVEGHPEHPNLRLALEELAFFSHEVRILGVYPAHPDRATVGNNGAG